MATGTGLGSQRASSGAEAAAWDETDPAAGAGLQYLMRQANSIAGGTTEMARNNISERVLGMPKDPGIDSTTPYRDLPVGTVGRD